MARARGMDGRVGHRELSSRAEAAPPARVLRRQGGAPAREDRAMSGEEGFLRRWSRLKSVPAQTHAEPPAERVEPPPGREAGAIEPPAQTPPPPIESLTPESDFTPFMQEDVDPALRRGALKK